MTAEIVNLNKFRKRLNRDTKDRQAQINRLKFGQTKAEKRRQEYEAQRDAKILSGKQLEDDPPEGA
ncbi:MAG: DUF4169 family protein [Rhodospirillales bacterium]|nr:DUF4169 family protein [Rhodospirillales bacterium]